MIMAFLGIFSVDHCTGSRVPIREDWNQQKKKKKKQKKKLCCF